MTSVKIYSYYKWLSLVTLIVSIAGTITLEEEGEDIVNKFWIALLVNFQFHLAFQFISRVPYGIYKYVECNNHQMKITAYKLLKFFSWLIMILPVMD